MNFLTGLLPVKSVFLYEKRKFLETHARRFSPSLDGSNDIRRLEKCCRTKDWIGLAERRKIGHFWGL